MAAPPARARADYDYLIKLLLIGDSGMYFVWLIEMRYCFYNLDLLAHFCMQLNSLIRDFCDILLICMDLVCDCGKCVIISAKSC